MQLELPDSFNPSHMLAKWNTIKYKQNSPAAGGLNIFVDECHITSNHEVQTTTPDIAFPDFIFNDLARSKILFGRRFL